MAGPSGQPRQPQGEVHSRPESHQYVRTGVLLRLVWILPCLLVLVSHVRAPMVIIDLTNFRFRYAFPPLLTLTIAKDLGLTSTDIANSNIIALVAT